MLGERGSWDSLVQFLKTEETSSLRGLSCWDCGMSGDGMQEIFLALESNSFLEMIGSNAANLSSMNQMIESLPKMKKLRWLLVRGDGQDTPQSFDQRLVDAVKQNKSLHDFRLQIHGVVSHCTKNAIKFYVRRNLLNPCILGSSTNMGDDDANHNVEALAPSVWPTIAPVSMRQRSLGMGIATTKSTSR